MANDPITTKFKVDISEFKKGITEANRILKENKSELKSVASEMDLYGTSSDGVRKQLDLMKSSLEAQTKKLESYKSQLAAAEKYEKEAAENVEQLKKKLEQLAAQGFDETSDEVQKYQKELSSAEKTHESLKSQVSNLTSTMNNQQAEVNKAQKEFNDLEGELKDVEDAERKAAKTGQSVDDVLDDMADSADGASGGFTVLKGALANLVAEGIQMATQAIKDFVAETIKVGKEFDSSMSQVEAVSGATGSELEALRDKAKEMGANTVFSASEAADAFNYMAMAGWKTEDMLDGIEGVLNLAAASGTDLATTSDIVTDALTAMGYSAGDAGRLADVMAAASSNANTNVEMMGATFQYAAPIIGAMGYNMEDAAVAIGLMANAGIKGEKSGTALRSIMTRLAAPPKEAATAMEALGISITNADGSMKPLAEVMEILRQKFDGLGEAEQAQYAKQIAGQEAMSGLLAIVNAAPDDYEKLTEAVKNSNGAAEEMAATMQDNLGGDMTQLGSKIEGVQIALYEKFEPAMRKGVEVLSKLVDGMSFLVEHSTAVVTALKAMGAGVAAYVAYTTAIKVMEGGWMALTVVQKAAAAAQWLLNAAMSANPIGLIIAAVAALVVAFIALWKNSEEFRNFWINLWEKVKEVTKTAIDAVKGFFSGVIDWIKENWQGLALFLVNPIAGAFKLIYDNVEGFRNVVDNAVSAVKGFFTGLWEGLVGGFKAAIDWIKENWQSMLLFMMNPLAGVFKYCYEHFEGFRNFVDGIVQAVKGFFTGMW
ncbi:MAG: phage tail tape measure protein, partial [Bacteroidales bacterium]|nr:phage tail tape measure protein [Bacteroidales bacterium]